MCISGLSKLIFHVLRGIVRVACVAGAAGCESRRVASEPPYSISGEALVEFASVEAASEIQPDSSPILSWLATRLDSTSPLNPTLHQSSHGFATRFDGFATKTKALAREIPPATQAIVSEDDCHFRIRSTTFCSHFAPHDTHSLRYDAMNELENDFALFSRDYKLAKSAVEMYN